MIKQIMPTRMKDLGYALDGYDKTSIYGVSFEDGKFQGLSSGADDKGIYFLGQFLHSAFGFDVSAIINFFHIFFIGSGILLFVLGWFLMLKGKISKTIAIFATLFLAAIVFKIGDVYIMFFFMTSFIPIFMYFVNSKSHKLYIFLTIFFIFAFISNIIRSYSATGVIIFAIAYLFISQIGYKKYTPIVLVGVIFLCLNLFYNHMFIKKSEEFIAKNNPEAVLNQKHVFWHSIYIGFGYVDSDYIPRYLDEVAMQKVWEIKPDTVYLSEQYEEILKSETFKFVKEHFLLFFQNLFAKFGVMLGYFIVFANLGIYCFYRSKDKKIAFFIPFILALGFNSLFGFLAVSSLNYLIGFISFAVIFAVFYIDNFLKEGNLCFKQ